MSRDFEIDKIDKSPQIETRGDDQRQERDRGLKITHELTPDDLYRMGYYTRVSTKSLEAARIIQ